MSKNDPASSKRERNKTIRWVVTIFLVTIFVSGTISFASNELMAVSSVAVAFIILLVIVLAINLGTKALTKRFDVTGN